MHRLFEPIQIGTLHVKNRIVMPAMGTGFGNQDGTVSERLIQYYVERAKGGVGLIIVEFTCVARGGRSMDRQLCVWGDEFIPPLKNLVDAVHMHGARIALQLHHAGRQTNKGVAGSQPIAASAIPCPLVREMPREATVQEIEAIVLAFGQGARRAREAGFDAIELHGGHGYLIDNFLSAYSNKRTDHYGGDLERRMNLALEAVASVRNSVGPHFPLSFRMSADEYVPEGLTLAETKILARRLQDAGVDCINVSAGTFGSAPKIVQPGSEPRGCLVHLAQEIKTAVDVPVITVGRINDPRLAETILQEKKADLIAMGRALVADPELPNKAKEGRLEDIRMCTACCLCIDTTIEGQPSIVCSVNAALGREVESRPVTTARPKTVLVIGGGPAGLEAARIAAHRGHKVTLCEEGTKLGGQLLLAAMPPHKQEMSNLTAFLTTEITKLHVDVKLGRRITAALIQELKPKVVVLATGSAPSLPVIPGVATSNVVTARDVIAGTRAVGKRVVIIGGGQIGCETAELLASQSKQVTIVEMLGSIARDMGLVSKRSLLNRLRAIGVVMLTRARVDEITASGVMVSVDGERRTVEADSVVLATGATPNVELQMQLSGKVQELHVIGDCHEVNKVVDAIREGYDVGMLI